MSKRTSVRIPDDLHQQLTERAQREHRTISNLIVALLSEKIEEEARNVATSVAASTKDDGSPPS
jgi:predicted DNA-binding protein